MFAPLGFAIHWVPGAAGHRMWQRPGAGRPLRPAPARSGPSPGRRRKRAGALRRARRARAAAAREFKGSGPGPAAPRSGRGWNFPARTIRAGSGAPGWGRSRAGAGRSGSGRGPAPAEGLPAPDLCNIWCPQCSKSPPGMDGNRTSPRIPAHFPNSSSWFLAPAPQTRVAAVRRFCDARARPHTHRTRDTKVVFFV